MGRMLDRFQLAMDSQLGVIFILLLSLMAVVGIVYACLLWRQKRKDLLAYLNRAYYEKAEATIKGFEFVGEHRADFFGRASAVRSKARHFGLCVIPVPSQATTDCRLRYQEFSRTIKQKTLPLFASHIWKQDEDVLVVIQSGMLQHNGKPLEKISTFIKDRRLGKAYAEEILSKIATAFAELHQLKTEDGEALYHGMLLPRSILLDLDVNRMINRVTIADLGFAFCFGPKQIAKQLSQLNKGTLPIDRLVQKNLLSEQVMLAPEQKDLTRIGEVGQASDFYAFATLATTLFTQEMFVSKGTVNWEMVPERWRPFLKSCLEDKAKNRPKDFGELKDWLEDPDLQLTIHSSTCDSDHEFSPSITNQELDDLVGVLQKVQDRKVHTSHTRNQNMTNGLEAIDQGDFREAKKCLLPVYEKEPHNAEVLVGLAVASYELGELEDAEKFYNLAEKECPESARNFREHIAFRI